MGILIGGVLDLRTHYAMIKKMAQPAKAWASKVKTEFKTGLANSLYMHGREALDHGECDKAIALISGSIKLVSPNRGVAHNDLGAAYFFKGEAVKGIKYLDTAIEKAEAWKIEDYLNVQRYKDLFLFHHNKGTAFFQLNEWKLAIDEFDEAQQQMIEGAFTSVAAKAKELREKGENDWQEKACAAKSENIDFQLMNYLFFYRGRAYLYNANFDKAIEDFNILIRLFGKADKKIKKSSGILYHFKALAHIGKKDFKNAIKDVRAAQKLGYKIPKALIKKLEKESGRKV